MKKFNVKKNAKSFFVAGIALIFCLCCFVFSGCSYTNQAIEWYSGKETPEKNYGNNGDFYIDTDDYLLYQKQNGVWSVLIKDFGKPGTEGTDGTDGTDGTNGVDGKDGQTPYIGTNGNWFIGTTDTGYKAVGADGKSATISIDSDGYWVINGEKTNYCAKITQSDLYSHLNNILEYDVSSVDAYYSSVANYETSAVWQYKNSTFSGWGSNIGAPSRIDSLMFKVRARDTAITQIKVYLTVPTEREQLKLTTNYIQATLDVNIQPYEEKDVIWILDEPIENTNSQNYYFAFNCNNYCDAYLPREDLTLTDGDGYDYTAYFIKGNFETSTLNNIYYVTSRYSKMLPVQIGNATYQFKLKDSVIQDILSNLDEKLYKNCTLALPQTIYGSVGQTMQIYLRNIIAYNLEDVNISVKTSTTTSSKLYSDRWEYTPTKEETFELEISLYSKNWELITKQTSNVIIKNATGSANVMVIGDSTVNAGVETKTMVDLSDSDDNFNLTLFGTRGSGTNKYEGRGGWTANGYYNSEKIGDLTNPFYNAEKGHFDFSYYMDQNGYTDLDVVFLQLGINDIFSCTDETLQASINKFKLALTNIITSIHDYSSSIKVVVNLVIPCEQDQNKFTETYGLLQTVWGYMRNCYCLNLEILNSFSNMNNVYVSWYNSAIDCVNNQGGNVHPNNDGYTQLGKQMYYYLKALMSI